MTSSHDSGSTIELLSPVSASHGKPKHKKRVDADDSSLTGTPSATPGCPKCSAELVETTAKSLCERDDFAYGVVCSACGARFEATDDSSKVWSCGSCPGTALCASCAPKVPAATATAASAALEDDPAVAAEFREMKCFREHATASSERLLVASAPAHPGITCKLCDREPAPGPVLACGRCDWRLCAECARTILRHCDVGQRDDPAAPAATTATTGSHSGLLQGSFATALAHPKSARHLFKPITPSVRESHPLLRMAFRCDRCSAFEPASSPAELVAFMCPVCTEMICKNCLRNIGSASSSSSSSPSPASTAVPPAGVADVSCYWCCSKERTEVERGNDWWTKKVIEQEREMVTRAKPARSLLLKPAPTSRPGLAEFQALEVSIHLQKRMPRAIRFEVESVKSEGGEDTLNPLIRAVIENGRWPLHTTCRLVTLCKIEFKRTHRASELWQAQVDLLAKMACDMAKQLETGEIDNLMMHADPRSPATSLLDVATEAGLKDLLSDSRVQQSLNKCWTSVLHTERSSTLFAFLCSRILLLLVSACMKALDVLTCHAFARYTGSRPRRFPWKYLGSGTRGSALHSLEIFHMSFSPMMAFYLNVLAFWAFIVVASYGATVSVRPRIEGYEIALLMWLVGFVIRFCEQTYRLGFRSFIGDIWNKLEVAHCIVYVAAGTLKVIACLTENPAHRNSLLLSYDVCYCLALLVTYVLALHVLVPSRLIGPLLVAFGLMIKDVIRVIILVAVVTVASAFAIYKINSSTVDFVVPDTPSSGAASREISQTFKTLLFSVVGNADLVVNNEVRTTVGTIIMVVFLILSTIVLMNLLIAAMCDTFSKVHSESEKEYKLRLAALIHQYSDSASVPSPLNIIVVIAWIFVKLTTVSVACCCPCFPGPEDFLHGLSGAFLAEIGATWRPGHMLAFLRMYVDKYLPWWNARLDLITREAVRRKLVAWLQSPTRQATDARSIEELVEEILSKKLPSVGSVAGAPSP